MKNFLIFLLKIVLTLVYSLAYLYFIKEGIDAFMYDKQFDLAFNIVSFVISIQLYNLCIDLINSYFK